MPSLTHLRTEQRRVNLSRVRAALCALSVSLVSAPPRPMKEDQHSPGTAVSPRTSRKVPYFVLFAAIVLLLGGLSYNLLPNSTASRENLVWMTPQAAARVLQPGKLDVIKFRLLRASSIAWNWYLKGKRQITMESRLYSFSTNASQPKGLPQTVFRNVDGARCWILSSEEWTNLKRELEGGTGISTMSVSRVTTLEGGQSSVSSGTMKVDSLPKIVGSFFDLLVCVTSTTGSAATIQTNFAMAARVKLRNGGAMVVNGPGRPVAGEANYWYILSSQAIDRAENPINL
jgi:hypothetical protein